MERLRNGCIIFHARTEITFSTTYYLRIIRIILLAFRKIAENIERYMQGLFFRM